MITNIRIAFASVIASLFASALLYAQQPYSGQLRTDPSVGNVQGIQRIGRALKTDPDQGGGFTYHVFPTVPASAPVVFAGGVQPRIPDVKTEPKLEPTQNPRPQQTAQHARKPSGPVLSTAFLQEELPPPLRPPDQDSPNRTPGEPEDDGDQTEKEGEDPANSKTKQQPGAYVQPQTNIAPPLYPTPFDWTNGIRNFGSPVAPQNPLALPSPWALPGAPVEIQGGVVTRDELAYRIDQIYHQPLIQIRMRIVEVDRTDAIAFGSILEYVSRKDDATPSSLTSGETANTGSAGPPGVKNVRSFSKFLVPELATSATAGSGTLVNLTAKHINWLIQGLSTELSADVITAPEVITLNGQNVEFVSGERLPFQLGQNVIQGTNNNIQQVFYKHVGTMVSVTPRIVNWGFHGEGRGEASLQASDVLDWGGLVNEMASRQETDNVKFIKPDGNDVGKILEAFRDKNYIPFSAQTELLLALNNYSKGEIERLIPLVESEIIDEAFLARCKNWEAKNCTIDLALVVRLSDGTPASVDDPDTSNTFAVTSSESNIRAVANVIQVKSGHGVAMAGLIGERETEEQSKVPLLGDLPVVGAAFRSKSVARVKSEVLIFIEAKVLEPDPWLARAESSQNFRLSRDYVEGDVLDNPLEVGMHRIGFGTYLPPRTNCEKMFWEKYHREIRKVHTHVQDTIGP